MNYLGEIAALGSSALWAISAMLFSALLEKASATQMNLLKGLIGLVFMITAAYTLVDAPPTFQLDRNTALLLLSGVIGIGLGDSLYFASLYHMGPRKALIVTLLSVPVAALCSWWWFNEKLTLQACLAIALTLVGIAWVIWERSTPAFGARGSLKRGALLSLACALANGVAAALTGMVQRSNDLDPLWVAVMRLGGGTACVWFLLKCMPSQNKKIQNMPIGLLVIAVFIGTFLGIWFMQVSFEHCSVGKAQTLLSASPLFVVPLAMMKGEKITLRSILGLLVALVGTALLIRSKG